MAIIYTNSYIKSSDLNPGNLLDNFEAYAEKLENVANHYRKLVNAMREKSIEILDAHGNTKEGRFVVDEIDAGRLNQAGCIIDFSKCEGEDPVFYTDEVLDGIINDSASLLDDLDDEMYENEIIEDTLDEIEESKMFNSIIEIVEDDDDVCYEGNIGKEIPQGSSEVSQIESIKNLISKDLSKKKNPKGVVPGYIGIEVDKLEEDKYSFNIVIADLLRDPPVIQFDRENCSFKYKCFTCDKWHYESLDSAYRSLKTATALISNFIKMIDIKHKSFGIALDFIDHDLRLLQSLLRVDYALEDSQDLDKELGDEIFEFDDDDVDEDE